MLSRALYRSEVTEGYQKDAHLSGQALHVLALRWGPWNNNHAEHAVKQFAYYREIADGYFSETGLQDYLVLLSLPSPANTRM